MQICALCPETSREAVLSFHHVRADERLTLEIALCEGCANRIEKHLKRAVPKRLMERSPLQALRLAS